MSATGKTKKQDDRATASLCRDFNCQAPSPAPNRLAEMLAGLG